jgi:hypothetical protein
VIGWVIGRFPHQSVLSFEAQPLFAAKGVICPTPRCQVERKQAAGGGSSNDVKEVCAGREECPRLPHLGATESSTGRLNHQFVDFATSFTSAICKGERCAGWNTLGHKHTHQNQSTCGLHLGLLSYLPKICPCVQSSSRSPLGAAPSRPPRWCSPNTPGLLLEEASHEAVSILTCIGLQC